MRILLRYDPARVARKEAGKYAIDHVRIERQGDRCFAIATDGREYVRVPVEMDGSDVTGNYPPVAFREAREAAIRAFLDNDAICPLVEFVQSDRSAVGVSLLRDGTAQSGDITYTSSESSRPFPALSDSKNVPSGDPLVVFKLDARRLLNLALALGCEATEEMVPVEIAVHSAQHALVVRPAREGDEAIGYLMPITEAP